MSRASYPRLIVAVFFMMFVNIMLPSKLSAQSRDYVLENARQAEKRCKYYLSVYAIFQNEARFLKEWIEFHKMMGAEHFFLNNNNSTDNFMEVLEPYIQSGEVELFHWDPPKGMHNFGQVEAYANAVRYTLGKTRWLAAIDIDEFIVPNEDWSTITDYLRAHEDSDQVLLWWHMFGTSHVDRIPDDKLLIDALRMRQKWRSNTWTDSKAIVKPHCVTAAGVHRCYLFSPFVTIESNPGMQQEHPSLRINHYFHRDIEFILTEKQKRREKYEGRKWTEKELLGHINLYNDVEDNSMDRFVTELSWRVFEKAPSKRVTINSR